MYYRYTLRRYFNMQLKEKYNKCVPRIDPLNTSFEALL